MAESMTAEQADAAISEIARAAVADPAAQAAEAAAAADAEAKAKAEADAKANAGADADSKEDEGDDGDADNPYKNPTDRRNFRALRESNSLLQDFARGQKDRADRLEKELQDLRTPPKKHPLEERLEKLSPEARERMKADGTLDLLLGTVEEVKGLGALKSTVEELRGSLQNDAAERRYWSALSQYAKDNGLSREDAEEIDSLISQGLVGGRGVEAFKNARQVLEWKRGTTGAKGGTDADKAAAAARKAAASGADASAGAAAGSPVSSQKQLNEKYEELRKTNPAEADRVLLAAMTNPGDLPRMRVGAPPK